MASATAWLWISTTIASQTRFHLWVSFLEKGRTRTPKINLNFISVPRTILLKFHQD